MCVVCVVSEGVRLYIGERVCVSYCVELHTCHYLQKTC